MRERPCIRCKLTPDGAEGTYFCQECLDKERGEKRKEQKRCTLCGEYKEKSAFYTNGRKADGQQRFHSWCKSCASKINKKYSAANAEYIRLKTKKWKLKNIERHRLKRKKENLERKTKVLSYYSKGTPSCACCGEEYIHFLQLDHIEGDGRKHRRELGSAGKMFYRWLIQSNFPDDGYQVLCANCHLAKTILGRCPRHD